MKSLLIFVLVFFSLPAFAGTWAYPVTNTSLIDPNISSVTIAVGTTAVQQQAIAASHGYPNTYIFSPGTTCSTLGQIHRYYLVDWIPKPTPLRPARTGKISFYSQTCGL